MILLLLMMYLMEECPVTCPTCPSQQYPQSYSGCLTILYHIISYHVMILHFHVAWKSVIYLWTPSIWMMFMSIVLPDDLPSDFDDSAVEGSTSCHDIHHLMSLNVTRFNHLPAKSTSNVAVLSFDVFFCVISCNNDLTDFVKVAVANINCGLSGKFRIYHIKCQRQVSGQVSWFDSPSLLFWIR